MLDIVTGLKEFKAQHICHGAVRAQDLIFIFHREQLAVISMQTLPQASDLKLIGKKLYCFGEFQGLRCFFYEDCVPPEWGLVLVPIRALQDKLEENFYLLSALANHLQHWRSMHRFCGRCGGPMHDVIEERARGCVKCEAVIYPRISPCVIVLIRRGAEILLIRSPHFRPGVYALVAGFIEPGESVEQAVSREVLEETGLQIKNVQYLFSQPWPFPDSLMLGFIADYASGELRLQTEEIEDGGWFSVDQLPLLPHEHSIARSLINQFVNGNI